MSENVVSFLIALDEQFEQILDGQRVRLSGYVANLMATIPTALAPGWSIAYHPPETYAPSQSALDCTWQTSDGKACVRVDVGVLENGKHTLIRLGINYEHSTFAGLPDGTSRTDPTVLALMRHLAAAVAANLLHSQLGFVAQFDPSEHEMIEHWIQRDAGLWSLFYYEEGLLVAASLTLQFRGQLESVHRYLVDGVLARVLGSTHDCRVDLTQVRDNAVVRVDAPTREQAEAVAHAIRCAWDRQTRLSSMSMTVREEVSLQRPNIPSLGSTSHTAWRWNLDNDTISLPRSPRLFVIYARADEEFRDELVKHLAVLRRQGFIHWDDQFVVPGEDWNSRIQAELYNSNVILMLVSPDFMDSRYILEHEVKPALELQAANKARVVPIIVRSVDWTFSPLGKLQVFPKDALPLNKWQDRDEAWLRIVEGLRRIVTVLDSEAETSSV